MLLTDNLGPGTSVESLDVLAEMVKSVDPNMGQYAKWIKERRYPNSTKIDVTPTLVCYISMSKVEFILSSQKPRKMGDYCTHGPFKTHFGKFSVFHMGTPGRDHIWAYFITLKVNQIALWRHQNLKVN